VLQKPEAEEVQPDAVFLYPTAVEKFPSERLQIPRAVDEYPTVEVADGVPVITPVASVSVAPVELFRRPITTDPRPPVEVKFELPKTEEFKVEAVLLKPKAEEQ